VKACAQGVGNLYFEGDGEGLVEWSGLRFDELLGRHDRPAVAMSTVVANGVAGRPGPGLLTVSEDKIYYTALTLTKDKIGYMSTHVTMNIGGGRVDPKFHLPIVDPAADPQHQAWYTKITKLSNDGFASEKGFWDLDPGHQEVNAKDALTGDAAKQAIAKWIEVEKARIEKMPARVRSIQPGSMPLSELRYIQTGLCACESLAPKEVEHVRKTMTDRAYPTSARETSGETRRIEYGDLACGMV
jgi:hypothetical protein